MAKKAAKAAPRYVEPEEETQEVPEEPETDTREAAGGKAVSKAKAVRAALDAGIESPDKGVDFVMKRYGMEVSKPHFSAIKSQYKNKAGVAAKGKPGRKPKAAPGRAVEGNLDPPPKQTMSGGSELLDAMEAMKPLVASLGKEQVKRIVDLLG